MQLTQTLPNSILSAREDGFGFFYGHLPGDNRQINVRYEGTRGWVAYVGGEDIGAGGSLYVAERAAILWMRDHPEE